MLLAASYHRRMLENGLLDFDSILAYGRVVLDFAETGAIAVGTLAEALLGEDERYGAETCHVVHNNAFRTRNGGGALHLSSLPTFGAKWLIPRLPQFQQQHPQVTLHFVPYVHSYDFERPELDCSILFGEGP
mgnify:CR=1 FL=1